MYLCRVGLGLPIRFGVGEAASRPRRWVGSWRWKHLPVGIDELSFLFFVFLFFFPMCSQGGFDCGQDERGTWHALAQVRLFRRGLLSLCLSYLPIAPTWNRSTT